MSTEISIVGKVVLLLHLAGREVGGRRTSERQSTPRGLALMAGPWERLCEDRAVVFATAQDVKLLSPGDLRRFFHTRPRRDRGKELGVVRRCFEDEPATSPVMISESRTMSPYQLNVNTLPMCTCP